MYIFHYKLFSGTMLTVVTKAWNASLHKLIFLTKHRKNKLNH